MPPPSAVEGAVLVPAISAVRVLFLRAVLVSDSMLIYAFPNHLVLPSKSRATPEASDRLGRRARKARGRQILPTRIGI
jgi:hypothetical protein